MRRLAALVGAIFLLVGCSPSNPQRPQVPPSPTTTSSTNTTPDRTPAGGPRVLATGLEVPWDLAVLSEESILVTLRDRAELVRIVEGQAPSVVARIPEARPGGEGGLLGIALSPEFGTDSLIYLYYTAETDNRVVRYRYGADGLTDARPIVTGIPKAQNHNGGRLRFGPDGLLYIGTGDAGRSELAQDTSALGGKILRVAPDGSIPEGNPFGNAVFSYGHRNVQGLGWDSSGRLYASEFGQNAWDELNLITAGANYGWPQTEGDTDVAGVTRPALVWTTAEASPSGIAVTPEGAVYIAALRGERVWLTRRTDEGMSKPEVFLDGWGRIRDVEVVGDELYVLTNNTARGNPRPDDDQLIAVPLR